MANNYTESVAIEKRDAIENMNFIFKLRIIVLFSFSTESQVAKEKSFRCHSKIDQCVRGENIEIELAGAEAHYVDEDEGNDKYIIIDKVFKADERSPKAMENWALERYIPMASLDNSFCMTSLNMKTLIRMTSAHPINQGD